MKKLISMSGLLFIASLVFAQDTIPPANTSPLNSMKTDTIPNSDKWNKDTAATGLAKNQWADTAMKKTAPDPSTGGNNNNNKWPDTSAKSATMQQGKDTMSSGTTSPQTTAKASTMAAPPTIVEDKVIMMDEKVFVVKNGDSTLLSDSLTLPSGAVVKNDATVIFKDGSTTKLKNGQYISIKPPAEEASAAKPDSATATTTAKTPEEDKVVMKDDQVIVIKNGDSTLLEDSITLASGAVVNKDGSVRFSTGSVTKLKNGQFIELNSAPVEAKKTKMKTVKKKKRS